MKNNCAIPKFIIAMLVTFFLCQALLAMPIIAKKQHALILLSYHRGMDWEEGILQGIRESLATHGERLILHIEYMDSKRFTALSYQRRLHSLLRHKYKKTKLDVIITIDSPAFYFINKHPTLAPNVPVIFCGLNNTLKKKKRQERPCSGVIESFNIRETIRTALYLHSTTKKIMLISDNLEKYSHSNDELTMLENEFAHINFTTIGNLQQTNLLKKIKELDDNTIILLATFTRSRSKNFFGYHRIISQIINTATVPIYGIWDFYLGTGIVGGKMTSAREHGRSAGKLAEKILQGEKIATLPIVKAPGRYKFDFEKLSHFNISHSKLPDNSVIVNRPFNFYKEHLAEIILVLIFILLLTFAIILLLLNIKKRKYSESQLRRSEKRLQLQVVKRTALLEEANIELSHSLDELEKDAEAGKQIQFQLLPDPTAQFGKYRFDRLLLPSRFLSGDFLDYFEIDNKHIGFYMADVSGHGLPSSFITVFLKSLIDRYLERYRLNADYSILNPAMLLKNLNKEILRQNIDKHLTLFFAIIDRENNQMIFSNGGQYPFPILHSSEKTAYIEKNSPPVGMFDFSKYVNITIQLPDTFRLAIFSDGILEILTEEDPLEEKEGTLLNLIKKKKFSISYLEKELHLTDSNNLPDDITLLLLTKESN